MPTAYEEALDLLAENRPGDSIYDALIASPPAMPGPPWSASTAVPGGPMSSAASTCGF
jgi:hypothetical protein